jgi:O-antigen/teichoic acid export membrane protein
VKVIHRLGVASARLARPERRLAAIAGSVVGSNLVTSTLGLVFWLVAARGLAPAPLGTLGVATVVMTFLGMLGSLGLGPLLISELPRAPRHRRWELFVTGTAVAAVFGGVLSGAFAAVAATTGDTWAPLHALGPSWWWFTLGGALTAVSNVLDNAMLVVGNPTAQVWRNTLASTWKVAVLAAAVPLALLDVAIGLAAWTTGLLLGATVAARAATTCMPGRRIVAPSRVLALIRQHAGPSVGHHGVSIGLGMGAVAMPTLISWIVTPAENGLFTTVRLVAAQACLLPFALSMALFAASAAEATFDVARSRRVLHVSLGLSLASYAGVFVLARWILLLFGSDYARSGVPYLRAMALAAPLLVFKDQYIAVSRARREVGSVMPFVLVATLLEVGLALTGGLRWGLMGAIAGWLVALAVQAVYVSPRLTWGGGVPQEAGGEAVADG